jgi:hypothetical protein
MGAWRGGRTGESEAVHSGDECGMHESRESLMYSCAWASTTTAAGNVGGVRRATGLERDHTLNPAYCAKSAPKKTIRRSTAALKRTRHPAAGIYGGEDREASPSARRGGENRGRHRRRVGGVRVPSLIRVPLWRQTCRHTRPARPQLVCSRSEITHAVASAVDLC